MEEIGANGRHLVNFRLFYLVSQVVGVTIFILVMSWVGIHLDGVSWASNPKTEFNWHPILMTLGMILLYGNSILIYRGFRYTRKKALKLTHAAIHAGAFFFTVIALIAVFDSHNLAKPAPIPNMYSLHSWIGLSAVILFALQYVVGFTSFLFPTFKVNVRETIMPAHVFFGVLGFVMACGAALLGISEKAFFSMGMNISSLPSEGLLVNCIGCLIVVYGAIVVYLVTETTYKREPLPEDAMLLTGDRRD